MQIVEIILLVIWIAFFAYWMISAWRDRAPYKRRSSRLSILSYMAVPVAIWLIVIGQLAPWLLVAKFLPDGIIAETAGIIITAAGVGFAIWARIHLGKNWSGQPSIRVDHKIIRTGPYSIVRHPIYTGILTGMVGTAIATGSVTAACLVLIVLAVFLLKIRIEEKFLLEEFGEEYARYKREVRGLIPYVV
jgi:protein-S-isoprenylcysteine O-methyltransferase Ste14